MSKPTKSRIAPIFLRAINLHVDVVMTQKVRVHVKQVGCIVPSGEKEGLGWI